MLTDWSCKHGTNPPQLATSQLLIQAAKGNQPAGKINYVMIFLPLLPSPLLHRNKLLASLLCLPSLPFMKASEFEWGHYYSFEEDLISTVPVSKLSFCGLNLQEYAQILFQLTYQVHHTVKWKDSLSISSHNCRLIISYHLPSSACVLIHGVLNSPAVASWSPWTLRDNSVQRTKLNSPSLSLSLQALLVNLKDFYITSGFAFCCSNEGDLLAVV